MKINELEILESTLVTPSQETPRHNIWLSNLDLAWNATHTPVVHFYRHNGARDFFASDIVKDALAKALVPFYPLAGRRVVDKDGRLEVQCNGEGVLLVVARLDLDIDEFVPSDKMAKLLVPSAEAAKVDPSLVSIFQVTYFKCGSVCIGAGMHHVLVDGRSGFAFTNAWSRLARGLPLDSIDPPFFDHTMFRARSPPYYIPSNHPEYTPSPPPQPSLPPIPCIVSVLKLTKSQLNSLKTQSNGSTVSTYQAIAVHIWRSNCIARGLKPCETTKLYTVVDIRNRVKPPLPAEYFGSGLYLTSTTTTVGDIVSKPIEFGASKIRATVSQVDDELVRSLIDYLEGFEYKYEACVVSRPIARSDIYVVSWAGMDAMKADFGWGGPALIVRAKLICGYAIVSEGKDGAVTVTVALEPEIVEKFKQEFYGWIRCDGVQVIAED